MSARCSTDGCGRPVQARSLCQRHYRHDLDARPASDRRGRTAVTAVIGNTPDLPGARCVGRAGLFDATSATGGTPQDRDRRDEARATALAVCRTCPVLDACRVWVAGLRPTHRPRGIVAGLFVTSDGSVRQGAAASRERPDAQRRGEPRNGRTGR